MSLLDADELKKEAAERCSAELHFHDGCGGQYFTVDNPTEELKEHITVFLAAKNLSPVFSENGKYFTVERNS